MPFKPMNRKDYLRWIGKYGWRLVDQHGLTKVRNIIVTHPGGEVVPASVKKTRAALKLAGLE